MTDNPHNDKIYKALAERYADAYGAALQQERRQLEQQNIDAVTPRLDARVRQMTGRAPRRRRWLMPVLAAAACLVLLLAVPSLLRNQAQQPLQPLALTFMLPDNFTVASIDYDDGQTVYKLDDMLQDDVVLTLQHDEGAPADYDGMLQIPIGGVTTYARSTNDYHLLLFSYGDVLYTLSCRYDINTLVALCQAAVT